MSCTCTFIESNHVVSFSPTAQQCHPWSHAASIDESTTGPTENSCIEPLFTDTVVYAQMIIHPAAPEPITRLPR